MGHSAGGWLGRALMAKLGPEWAAAHVAALVTLGTPHRAPPEGFPDMTRGVLMNVNMDAPEDALAAEGVSYVSVCGEAISGADGAERGSPEAIAFNSYKMVCGYGEVSGDGVVPLQSAHLTGTCQQVTIPGAVHSINLAGSVEPSNMWYGAEPVVDLWLPSVISLLRRSGVV